jgi:integrase
MRRPYWRAQSKTWVVKLPGGRLKTLGRDPHGGSRKRPPREIEEAWHHLDRQAKPKDMLFSEVADQYLDYLTNPKTRQTAREHLDWFKAFIGKAMKMSDLRVHHVNDYLKTKDWSDSMKATAVSRITSALNHAVAEGHIEDHKVRFARGKKPKYTRRETIPTEAQQKKLEDAAHPELRRILAALRETGCRPSEICAVTIDKVDLKERVMTVPNKTARTTGKKERDVYLSHAMVELIRSAIGGRTEGHVFLNAKGRPWRPDVIGNAVYRIRTKLGLPENVVAYVLRHDYISRAVNDTDANVALIARQVGHSNLNMMMKNYLHESPDAMRRTVDKIAESNKPGVKPGSRPRPRS